MSIISWTSPSASEVILPTSRLTSVAEILLVLPQQLTEAADQPAADRRRHRPPRLERLGRAGHGGVHVGRALPPEGGQRRPVDRRAHRAVTGERVEVDAAAGGGVLGLTAEVVGGGQGGHGELLWFGGVLRRC